jgi:hypothetical protein
MWVFNNGKLEQLDETLEKVVIELKGKLIMYMLRNANIEWLNDETEAELYSVLFDFLEPFILGKLLNEKGYSA